MGWLEAAKMGHSEIEKRMKEAMKPDRARVQIMNFHIGLN